MKQSEGDTEYPITIEAVERVSKSVGKCGTLIIEVFILADRGVVQESSEKQT